jgi:beta-barrel assembly-enhancing protease
MLPAFGRVQPTTGFDLYSREEEIAAGKQAMKETAREVPLLPSTSPVTKYVTDLGKTLIAHAPHIDQPWPYTFHVIDQPGINAFALPGGAVYINLGTVQAADNESELAGVLAHEIAHVIQRHGTRAASKQMAAQVPLALLAGMLGKTTAGEAPDMGISFGVGSYFLKNSRQSESEADLLGADIMYDAGFDPHGLVEFFTKLQNQNEDQAGQGSNSGDDFGEFFGDHPDPGNRVESVNHEITTLPSKLYATNTPQFFAVKQYAANMKPMTAEQAEAWRRKHSPTE